MQCVARRIVDRRMLHLVKMWLESPVAERDGNGNWKHTGSSGKGTPQGGVISPLLANLYAEQAREWTQAVMSRIGLTLNEQKTSIRDARTENFDFLGYQAVNLYVYDRVRHFLRRRHKVTSSKGSSQFPITHVFGALGVHRLRMVRR